METDNITDTNNTLSADNEPKIDSFYFYRVSSYTPFINHTLQDVLLNPLG
jgi:hypothetical protein